MSNITQTEKETLDQLYVYAQNIREYLRSSGIKKNAFISIYQSEYGPQCDTIYVRLAEIEGVTTRRGVMKFDNLVDGRTEYKEYDYG